MNGAGLIIAAPASGSGKTIVAAGLMRALRRRGVGVAAAKAGPDYIDSTLHAVACGRDCLNLDPWAMRPATLAALVAELEGAAELVICEGAMGLFDGTGADGESGSTAELAVHTGWPVVLVLDAARQGASVAALVAGFARHNPQVPVAGVILNRIGSDRHAAILDAAVARHVPKVDRLGAIRRDPELGLASRHLGLVPAGEQRNVEAAVARAADAVAGAVDLDRLIGMARPSRLGGNGAAPPLPPLGSHIAVACDRGFLFTYPAILAGWRRQGAELSFFSPLQDEPPDPKADAIFLPGGYPELHAARLAAATAFRAGLRRAASKGAAIYGECGGFMVLGDALIDAAGEVHAMAGLLPLTTSFAKRRLHLGYRAITLLGDGPLGVRGAGFRGHEFHYATVVSQGDGAEPLFAARDGAGCDLGFQGLRLGSVAGSFLHLIDRADPR